MSHLPAGPVHHLRLAVSNVQRSVAFYTEILGFQVAVDAPPPPDDENYEALVDSLQGGVILMHQGMFVGLRPVDEERPRSARRGRSEHGREPRERVLSPHEPRARVGGGHRTHRTQRWMPITRAPATSAQALWRAGTTLPGWPTARGSRSPPSARTDYAARRD